MKDYLILTKTLIMCGLDIRISKGKLNTSRSMSTIISAALIIVLVGMIVRSLIGVIDVIIAAGGTGYQLVEQGMSVGMLTAMIMGVPMIISSFYVSSDTTTLLSLPLSISTIAAARFTRCLFFDYSIVALFCLPSFIAFGIATGAGALYWVFAIILFLFIPLVPLVYGTVVVMLLMRLFRRLRNKRLLTGIGMVVSLVFVLVWVCLGMSGGNHDTLGMAASLSTFGQTGFLFPNLVFANMAIEQLSFMGLVLFIFSSAVLVAVFILIAKAVYFDSVIGMSEMGTRRGALSSKEATAFEDIHSPLSSYTHIERLKIRHSPFLIQALLSQLIWPVILIVSFVYATVGHPDTDLIGKLTTLAGSDGSMVYLLILTVAMTYLCSAANTIPSMAISLEGSGLSFMKTLPIRFRDHVEAKVRSTLTIDYLFANVLTFIATGFCILHGTTPLVLPAVLVVGFAGTVTVSYLQILFDLSKPNLNWSDQTSLNRKASTIFAMLACLVLGVVVSVVSVVPAFLLGLAALPTVVIDVVISVALAAGVRKAVLDYADKRLRQLP